MKRRISTSAAAFAILVAAAGLVACGEEPAGDSGGAGDSGALTIYSSLPLQGDTRSQSLDIIRGEEMALEQAGKKVGDREIKYVSLDDATAQAGSWDPQQVAANARKAVQDPSSIAYIGEFNSGASAISIPITNERDLLQITPAASYVGLTKGIGAIQPGEPEKYYPNGTRNFARVYPADHIQAAAQIAYMKQQGVKKVYVLHDNDTYGQGIAEALGELASDAGLEVVGPDGVEVEAANFRALAEKIARESPDAVFYGACPESAAVQVFKDLHVALPDASLYGPDCLADTSFTGQLPEEIQASTFLTAGTLPPEKYPPEGQAFFEDFREKYGKDPQIFAIYGFEAMSATLDAIERAGDEVTPAAVRDAFFEIADRESVIGTYSIDDEGDTTLGDYGAYRVENGKLVFDETLQVEAPQG